MGTVLVTGAAGRLGSVLSHGLSSSHALRLTDLPGADLDALSAYGETVAADLTDLDAAKRVCAGVDTVVHLAATPDPGAVWAQLLPMNVITTYNVMTAAVHAGCRRIVYASSIHAVSGYAPDVQVKTTDPVNPGDLYGVSKCFGEALGRYVAEQEGVSVIAIRIGAAQPAVVARDPQATPLLDAFLTDRDLLQLVDRCITVEGVRWALVHGLSDNRYKRLDLSDTCALLGYVPADDAMELSDEVPAALLARTAHNASAPEQPSGLRDDL
jgi:NAD(P)-dependent dehydrogenase (short-subunit alcohol dehydrogenase family)